MRLRALRQIELDTAQRFGVRVCTCDCAYVLMYFVCSYCNVCVCVDDGWVKGTNQGARCYSPFPEQQKAFLWI